MAAVTPGITSSRNPGEELTGEQKKSLSQKPSWPEVDNMVIVELQGKLGKQRKKLAREKGIGNA